MTQPEPWVVPLEFYEMIMSLPDGTDITEFFEFVDPEWAGFTVTVAKTQT